MTRYSASRGAHPARTFLLLAAVLTAWNVTGATPVHAERAGQMAAPAPILLPLSFEANRGQAGSGVGFVLRGSDFTALLSPRGARFTLSPVTRGGGGGGRLLRGSAPHLGSVLEGGSALHHSALPAVTARLQFVSTSTRARMVGLDRLPGVVNYLFGRDPRSWRTHIPTYARLAVQNIYPGIDLVYATRGRQLEYDWVIHPGGRPSSIRWRLSGPAAARLAGNGRLTLATDAGALIQQRPLAYRQPGSSKASAVHVVALGHAMFGLWVNRYDRSRELVIDPVIRFSTYVGGGLGDSIKSVAVDTAGNVYLAGLTASSDFPTKNAYPFHPAGGPDAPPHVFVTKLDAAGTGIVFSTYLGGSYFDEAFGVAQDATGVYIAGATESADFPMVHAFQDKLGGGSDAFIAKLAPSGDTLLYSSFMGGPKNDLAYAIAIDPAHDAYMTGDTIPLGGGSPNGPASLPHAFVVKAGPDGSLLYNVAISGDFQETGYAIAADAAGNAYVAGMTQSTDFPSELTPTPGLIGTQDAYVVKLDPTGKLLYSTQLGGNEASLAEAIALDASGNVYITGQTSSSNFPVVGGFQYHYGGNGRSLTAGDAFVAKLDRSGRLRYSTYLGGSRDDEGLGIGLDGRRNIYVTGWTDSADFPVKNAIQPAMIDSTCAYGVPCQHAFAAEISAGGRLAWSTYLGGSVSDQANTLAVDQQGNAYVAGATSSQDFPTMQALKSASTDTLGTSLDGFVVKLAHGTAPVNHSIVIDSIQVQARVGSTWQVTDTVRVGQRVRIVVVYHDRRGNALQTFGTLSVSRNGHELVQRLMYRGESGQASALGSTFRVTQAADVGTLRVTVAVISEGSTALKRVTFRVIPS